MDCVSKTVKADGVKALWKGFGPAMSRAFPANAATSVPPPLSPQSVRLLFSITDDFFLYGSDRFLGYELAMATMNSFSA